MTRQKKTLATCSAAHVLHDGLSDVTYVLLPLLAQTFGLSLAQVGMIRSAHRVAMASFQIPAGLIAERFGIVRMIVITELATGCGILATLALPGATSFLLLPLIGVVVNGTSSVLYGTIGDFVEPDRLSRAFGMFYTLGSICGIAAPLGYGLLGDLYGVETSIAVIGVAIFLTVPLAALLRPAGALKPVTR